MKIMARCMMEEEPSMEKTISTYGVLIWKSPFDWGLTTCLSDEMAPKAVLRPPTARPSSSILEEMLHYGEINVEAFLAHLLFINEGSPMSEKMSVDNEMTLGIE